MDEVERAARDEIKRIERDGYLGATSGQPKTGTEPRKSIENGTYVPDEENVAICLNCTKKKCRTGNCAKIMDAKKKKAEEARHV